MRRRAFLASAAIAFLAAGWASAGDIPDSLTYQGRLSDANGGAVADGEYNFHFQLFASSDGTDSLCDWLQPDVPIRGGVFRVEIGNTATGGAGSCANAIQDVLRSNDALWLAISIAGEALSPRIPIGATARAHHAQHAQNGVPVGTVLPFAGPVDNVIAMPPSGWLLCDGSAVSRTAYARLFEVIGTAHGAGDGTTTFNLPDYRGRFLRGVDLGAGRDPDADARLEAMPGGSTGDAAGSVQESCNLAHQHAGTTDSAGGHDHEVANLYTAGGGNQGIPFFGVDHGSATLLRSDTQGQHNHALSIDPSGGAESRPQNAYVSYIIKH
ncbi:MAG: tail fiber protein [Deltaproteobacteria bacterium]|nr:tail fiber protein [Deltaproteobacteria bacterium]